MHKNKKKRKQIKAIRLRNKKLLKKYPWLRAVDWWFRPIKGYDYTLLDDMSRGWRKCFGLMMVEDMDKARHGKPIITEQVKSKYGELRWYCSAPKEVQDVIEAYSALSTHICEHCGQVDVGYTSGWIMPICKKCFCHDDYYTEKDYYDQTSQWTRMPLDYSYKKLDGEKWIKYTIDISEYTNKVRVNWWKKHNAKLS